jgi:hypothetical protein
MEFLGCHKTKYTQTDAFNIKVVKPDGKTFFIPIEDMRNIINKIDLLADLAKIEKALAKL